ncbi:TetR/AcrR family transcriptional regulator [Porticoccus sp.]
MSQGRPREFDVDRALESATRQFWAVGYEATSLQDLLRVMRLSKSSLYQTFGSKQALFIKCLDHYQQSMTEKLLQQLARSASPKAFLHHFLEEVVAEAGAKTKAGKKGCFLVSSANELSQRDSDVRKAVATGSAHVATVFRRAFEQAVAQGEMTAPASLDALVDYFMTAVSGLRTMVKAGMKKEDLLPVIGFIMKTLE